MSIATLLSSSRAARACAVLVASTMVAACGDDDGRSVTLTLLTPEDGQILTLEDDTNPDEPGVQFDVTGESSGLRAETPIELYIDGEPEGSTARVDVAGQVTLSEVTLPPGTHTIHIETSVGSVRSDDQHRYTLRALVIESPEDGDELSEDANDAMDGFQIDVRVQGYALAAGEVELRADGDVVGTATPDADGTATFEDVTLDDGEHTLLARAGDVSSEPVEITIDSEPVQPPDPECGEVSLVSPSAASGASAIVLGGAACEDGAVTVDVEIAVERDDGTSVALELNGEQVGTGVVNDQAVTFEDVEISDATGNELTLVIGELDCEVDAVDIQVDCDAPNCFLRSPEPVESGGVLYVGLAQQAEGGGYDVEVETDDEASGEEVTLVIDGDEEDALTVDAGELGGDIVAVFAGVEVEDGVHTITATCRDAVGNETTTPPFEITVDTEACGVEISAPASDAIYLPGDDTTPGEPGIQVAGIAAVTGDDCVASRSGLCEAGGSPDADFAAFDGDSPHTSLLTLDSASINQTYCVEIRDRAGNVGRDEVSFMLRQVAPMVLIESPVTGTSFNAEGDDEHEADADSDTTLCDAAFTVACEVGTMVVLRRNDENGAVVGMGPCVADDDAPAGYTGRAAITAEISESLTDDSATFVATQVFMGGGGATLSGVSAAVTLGTDCEPPQVEEGTTPCSLHASNQITVDEAEDFVIELTDTSADTVSADLSYWTGEDVTDPLGDPTGTQIGTVTGGSSIGFASIDFGDIGPLVVAAALEDDFGNVTVYECESEIVAELPSISVTLFPVDGEEYGPGDSECDPGNGEYGLSVLAMVDHDEDRTASLTVNGEVVDADVTIDGMMIELCVAVPNDSENTPPGPTTVRLTVEEDIGNGFDFVESTFNVHTILITDPEDGDLVASDADCDDGAAFGTLVTVAFDAMHEGADYTVVADGDEVTGTVPTPTAPVELCVPMTTGGERTIVASIDGTDIEHSVTVTVVDDTPEIVSIDSPADGEDFGPGEGCVPNPPTSYGVLVEATLDQDENREADILVNGVVVADNVPIASDNTISRCVPVPDNLENSGDPTTITVSLVSTAGASIPATASVDIDVDTLVIVSPEAEVLLTEVNDCEPGTPAIDSEVVLEVDTMHIGRTVTITDGTAPEDVVILDDEVTACVELSSGTRLITASIGGTMVTDSVEVDVELPSPEILSVTAPTEGQMFGPNDPARCDAGAGNFGVRVQATVDQDEDRLAFITVNDGTPIAADISAAGEIDECVPVPDNLDNGGPSEIELRLEEEPGDRFDVVARNVSVDLLEVTAPTANQHFTPATDCDDTAGFGINVSVTVDAALSGEMYAIDGGLADLTGTIAATTIAGCLAVDEATTSVTVSIVGSSITETIPITVFTGGAPSMPVSFTSACPETDSPTYREDPVTLTWGDLSAREDYEGQFVSLELRCSHTDIASATSPDDWWEDASVITLPAGTDPSDTSVGIPFRVGETRHCVLRAANDQDEQTPLPPTATNVTCGFRSLVLNTGSLANGFLGIFNAPVGDVNGDGMDDMLVGGNGIAMLFFGRISPTAFTGAPDVTFTGPSALGFRVAGLGDFNGDDRNDFVITNGSFNGVRGRIYIYFGRDAGSAWPSTVDLTSECNADLCIDHTDASARFGGSIAGIGDFGGDGYASVAVTATGFGSNLGQLTIIQGDDYEVRACAVDNPCRTNESCVAGTCELAAGATFWGLSYEAPSGNWLNPPAGDPVSPVLRGFRLDGVAGTTNAVARSVTPVGAFDSTPGMDFVMSSLGTTTAPAVTAKLYFVSGRNDVDAGISVLTNADLGFRASMGGAPSGQPFEAVTAGFGSQMITLLNAVDITGGTPGSVDIMVRGQSAASAFIYAGDTSFAPANKIEVRGMTDFGIGMTRGYHPSIPSITDRFDDDVLSDFAIGNGGSPGSVYQFYADVIPSRVVNGVLSFREGSPVQPPAATGTTGRVVEAAGDLTNDGHPDLVVGDYQANTSTGQVHLLY